MKAITVRDDDAHSLAWETVPRPTHDSDEVVVRVRATAVNRADLLQRRGHYPPPDGASEILGLEASGVITETGDAVENWQVGDDVCALLPGGGYSEYVSVPADMLLPVPDGLDHTEAAGIPEVFYTAYLNIVLEADHSPGESVLIHAGASGVGTAAIQLCRLRDAPIFATASGGKLQVVRNLGADHAIDRHEESFPAVVDEVTDGAGVDVILDPVGADYLDDNIQSLATGGRQVLIGLLGGATEELSLARLLQQRLRIIGSVLRSRPASDKIALTDRIRREVWPHFDSGELRPIIYRELPITRAEQAHELLEHNETIGKVILTVS
jgi:putative PIG3 family NAD(P)H quinone oxidoreductase